MTAMEKVQSNLTAAMKANNVVAKNVLRVLLGNLQTIQTRQPAPLTDEQVVKSVKTLSGQIDEEIASRRGHAQYEGEITRLEAEKAVLAEFVPTYLDAEQIRAVLTTAENQAQVNASKNAAAATGTAIKILKAHGAVDGALVKEIVQSIYGA